MRNLFYLLNFFFLHLVYDASVHAQDYTLNIEDNVVAKFRNIIFEGCTDIDIRIDRPANLPNVALDIPFSVSGDAILGVDYTLVYNDTVSISSTTEFIKMDINQSQIKLVVNPIHDGIKESSELAIINFESFSLPLSTFTLTPNDDEFRYPLVDQPELRFSEITSDITLNCPGDEAIIESKLAGGVGGLTNNIASYSYEWSQIGIDRMQTVYPIDTTEYTVKGTDVCGTQFIFDTVKVNVRPFKDYDDIQAKLDSIYVCQEKELGKLCVSEMTGGQGSVYTYAWSKSDSESILSNDSCLVATYGEYEVSVSDICEFTPYEDSNFIYNDEAPDPYFEYLSVPDSAMMLEFNNYTPLSDGLTHEWFFQNVNDTSDTTKYIPNQYPVLFNGNRYTTVLVGDSINPVTIQTPGTYDVSLKVTTATAGCSKKYTEFISLEPSYFFYAPNAFTPNGDALNDTFKPVVTGAKNYEFFVYDGFGKVVYSSSDRREEWDGTYKGKPAAEGIYIYKVIMTKTSDVVVFSEQGTVTLIR